MHEELPLASAGWEIATEKVFCSYRTMQPEEWVARFSHGLLCSSFNRYRYRNEKLHQWIHRVHEIILERPGDIPVYRKKYLTEQEIQEINDYYL